MSNFDGAIVVVARNSAKLNDRARTMRHFKGSELLAIFEPVLSLILRRIELLGRFPELGAPMLGPFTGYRSTVVRMFRIVLPARAYHC